MFLFFSSRMREESCRGGQYRRSPVGDALRSRIQPFIHSQLRSAKERGIMCPFGRFIHTSESHLFFREN